MQPPHTPHPCPHPLGALGAGTLRNCKFSTSLPPGFKNASSNITQEKNGPFFGHRPIGFHASPHPPQLSSIPAWGSAPHNSANSRARRCIVLRVSGHFISGLLIALHCTEQNRNCGAPSIVGHPTTPPFGVGDFRRQPPLGKYGWSSHRRGRRPSGCDWDCEYLEVNLPPPPPAWYTAIPHA